MKRKKQHKKQKALRNRSIGDRKAPMPTQTEAGGHLPAWASGLFKSGWAPWVLMTLAVIISYAHTLDVPFYMDDFPSIVNNPAIRALGDMERIWRFAPLRVVGYFTLALNYHWHQLQMAGFHVMNIMIHWLTGMAVFWFARSLVRTPLLTDRLSPYGSRWFPFWAAMIFLLHPLQTQAVTYTIQRLAALAALFYISAMACYVQGRLVRGNRGAMFGWFAATGGCLVLAMLTKQNTVTLPLALLVVTVLFFPDSFKQACLKAGIVLIGYGVAWGVLGLILDYNPFSLEAMQALTRETTAIPRNVYMWTQFKVLWIYIKLFFWPVGLHLDYDIPLATTFFQGLVPFAALGHALLLAGGVFVYRRQPVLSFAILFFYLAHLVESSVLPIRDVCFEHRMYLPGMGLSLAVALGVTHLARVVKSEWGVSVLMSLLLIALGTLTWQRNELWRDPVRFWQDSVSHSPAKERTWNELVHQLLLAERNSEAAQVLFRSIRQRNAANQQRTQLEEPTIVNFITVLHRMGKYDEALKMANDALAKPLNPKSRFKILNNKGNVYFDLKKYHQAEADYDRAVAALPGNPAIQPVLFNLAVTRYRLGKYPEAMQAVDTLLEMPQSLTDKASALCVKGDIYWKQNASAAAEQVYRQALKIDPRSRAARDGLERL